MEGQVSERSVDENSSRRQVMQTHIDRPELHTLAGLNKLYPGIKTQVLLIKKDCIQT